MSWLGQRFLCCDGWVVWQLGLNWLESIGCYVALLRQHFAFSLEVRYTVHEVAANFQGSCFSEPKPLGIQTDHLNTGYPVNVIRSWWSMPMTQGRDIVVRTVLLLFYKIASAYYKYHTMSHPQHKCCAVILRINKPSLLLWKINSCWSFDFFFCPNCRCNNIIFEVICLCVYIAANTPRSDDNTIAGCITLLYLWATFITRVNVYAKNNHNPVAYIQNIKYIERSYTYVHLLTKQRNRNPGIGNI